MISRLRALVLEVYKSIHNLNPECIRDMFEVKALEYSLRNPVKVLQPKKRTTSYGLKTVSYTGAKLWNDLSHVLNSSVDYNEFKSLLTLLKRENLDPNFTYV